MHACCSARTSVSTHVSVHRNSAGTCTTVREDVHTWEGPGKGERTQHPTLRGAVVLTDTQEVSGGTCSLAPPTPGRRK